MIKIVAMIKRSTSVSFEEFRDYYEGRHAAFCWSVAPATVTDRIVLYRQNYARALGGDRSRAPFDCITEIGFADSEGLRVWNDWYLGDDASAVRHDEENFMDVSQRVVLVVEEGRPDQPSGARREPLSSV